jgi:arsenate reductase
MELVPKYSRKDLIVCFFSLHNLKTVLLLAFTLLLTKQLMAQEKKIIFVCQHGAAKSVIAASYFNKIAKERNLNFVAECRGVEPDSAVSKSTKDGLTKDKVFDPTTKPQKLSSADTANTEMIVLFTNLPEEIRTSVKIENWSKIENVDADYSTRRDAIIRKINELLDSLENNNK